MSEIALFQCEALKARISARQCLINQEQAKRRAAKQDKGWGQITPVGMLHFCLTCTQKNDINSQAETREKVEVESGQSNELKKEKLNMAEIMDATRIERLPAKPVVTATSIEKEPASVVKYCKNHPDREVFKRQGGIPLSICRECYLAALARGREEAQSRRAAGQGDKVPLKAAVVLNFTGREDLLATIQETAALEERTPAGQIMYWLKKAINRVPGTSRQAQE